MSSGGRKKPLPFVLPAKTMGKAFGFSKLTWVMTRVCDTGTYSERTHKSLFILKTRNIAALEKAEPSLAGLWMPLPEQTAAKMNALDWKSSLLGFFVVEHQIWLQEKEVLFCL